MRSFGSVEDQSSNRFVGPSSYILYLKGAATALSHRPSSIEGERRTNLPSVHQLDH